MGKRISLYFILFTIIFLSCDDENRVIPTPNTQVEERIPTPIFNADSAYDFIQTQVDFGPRVPNTKEHTACAEWLVKKLDSYGAKTMVQEGEVTAFNGDKLQIKNILAQFNPEKTSRLLLFSHWDTRPVADKDKSRQGEPIDGANDGGSGVGVLLEIARQFNLQETKLGVDIIFFDAEDYGTFEGSMNRGAKDDWCLGSQYWGNNPPIANYRPRFGILLDMVGETNAQYPKEYFSTYHAGNIVNKVWNTARNIGYSNYFINTKIGQITDDHRYVNILANIPSIDIIGWNTTTNTFGDYHHTHKDNMEGIDKNSLKAVGQTVMEVVYQEK